MLIEHLGYSPNIDPTARIAPTAVICGDVTVGPRCSIGFGAVLTAESGPVVIGADGVIMENAVIRGVRNFPVRIGDNVLIGPHAHVSGAQIAARVFIATGASVFNGARIGADAEIRINAVVHVNTRIAPGDHVPIGWVALGDPAQILPPGDAEAIWAAQEPLDFPRTVFDISRPPPGQSAMEAMTARYARALGKHKDDTVL
ncbi:gamma carbonic anhydrase family protein [Varunaivibrio sulfuroxidans]|uniref:Carbonic anhydrase/acetyltransferase-like protein (Isoleucine patch superfamily) n=1 Tax=Varunaivibrio sulfuroxidans TaxID=1773489 RepID=A0A4V2UP92_9PROT|nr:gamma carbonic anhydrase family protein [Varunaivibrio sulfuroxidans]TCS65041.1 carbonic anhydrase/acetyltransferase-like protein (isoleucine patch superfamily) [Varunaivibrio sulfuroxidans]WES29671.1 gamma carbonic anhydrase family protein [Varunaivibrio sulfuroxidans]